MKNKISREDSAYLWKLAWLKSQGKHKEARSHRIRTYLNKNKWYILGIVFLLVCLGYSLLEIYIGFKLGAY